MQYVRKYGGYVVILASVVYLVYTLFLGQGG